MNSQNSESPEIADSLLPQADPNIFVEPIQSKAEKVSRTNLILLGVTFLLFILLFSFGTWYAFLRDSNKENLENNHEEEGIQGGEPNVEVPREDLYVSSYDPEFEIDLEPTGLENAAYEKSISTGEYCDITPGIVSYQVGKKMMYINNIKLLRYEEDVEAYNSDVAFVKGLSEGSIEYQPSNSLTSFDVGCTSAAGYVMDMDFPVDYPGTDAVRGVVELGGFQAEWATPEQVSYSVYVYAVKDDYIIKLSDSLIDGSKLFSEDEIIGCGIEEGKSYIEDGVNTFPDSLECLKTLYLGNESSQALVQTDINNLIMSFPLEESQRESNLDNLTTYVNDTFGNFTVTYDKDEWSIAQEPPYPYSPESGHQQNRLILENDESRLIFVLNIIDGGRIFGNVTLFCSEELTTLDANGPYRLKRSDSEYLYAAKLATNSAGDVKRYEYFDVINATGSQGWFDIENGYCIYNNDSFQYTKEINPDPSQYGPTGSSNVYYVVNVAIQSKDGSALSTDSVSKADEVVKSLHIDSLE